MAVHDSEEIAHEHIKAPPVAVGAALTEVRVSGRVHLARSSAEQAYHLLDGLVSVSDRRTWLRASVGLGFWLGAPVHLLRTLGRAGRRSELHAVSRWWAGGLRRHLRMRLEMTGLKHIDPAEAYIVAPLHEGFADAIALLHLPLNMRFVARDELFGWRHFGGLLRDTGQVMVTPESGLLSYRELRRRAPSILDAGESLLIAPQGSVLGLEIDFRVGPFALAAALGRPILPVALTGTHRVWEYPFTPRLRYGQRVSLAVLPPVSAQEIRALGVEGARLELQRRLKQRVLRGDMAAPRRYVPARDGYWDGYAFSIDPEFPDLYRDIERHRSEQP